MIGDLIRLSIKQILSRGERERGEDTLILFAGVINHLENKLDPSQNDGFREERTQEAGKHDLNVEHANNVEVF